MLNQVINYSNYDNEIWELIQKEIKRQEEHIELIASENYASLYVMYVQGSQLTNKYAEGYPNKRYYGGCKYIDKIEKIAINRAKKLFNANYANVQPHSGSQANFAVYSALLSPGDRIMGLENSHGGHLTHGSIVNFSGKLYNNISYKVNNKGIIDYNDLLKLAKIHKPKMIIGGFSSYSGICDWKKMREIADLVKAYLLVDMAHIAGLVATGLYPNPVPYAHIVTTTTHKTLAGPRGGLILASENINNLFNKLDSSVFPGTQGGPLMHVIAAKAVALKEASEPKFLIYQKQVLKNAKLMVSILKKRNYKIVSNYTYNHLFLIDLSITNLTGIQAEKLLGKYNIIVNKNSIPNDLKSPFITSGIRIGTPAITRRGLKEYEVSLISNMIADILDAKNENILYIKEKILEICINFPVYRIK
ncbi:aminotransferase class I/II-fold pyridoxal phosphate-dependent enzyme [Enterobacteriaceae endosymbiont of Plateumaris consimilis]|uniref:serine hydroxymethyltransferase n=1 Tax=Enterobacteriaceae endosymbiont of Plateumaris consimilis TaxID=2675794 RepID=UPI001448B61A|nr:serine hydroxymethyltransferase [Enterobacteriaceae endosymbiont of Plateumaris consimilis]QJC28465.1 aminotransferase class I/II-fold pyridoxal phosphate-dependent enzyme [Enterobacteriaceae endosymbiont of Plateumaris consimilis]